MTERWLTVVDFPDYQVSSLGRLRRRVTSACGRYLAGAIIDGHVNSKGYREFGLTRDGKAKRQFAHRIICATFHGPPPTDQHQAAHGNGDKLDNYPANLRWATPAENDADKYLHGTKPLGERHPLAKLTRAKVREMRRSFQGRHGEKAQLARAYGVTKQSIASVLNGETWKESTPSPAAITINQGA